MSSKRTDDQKQIEAWGLTVAQVEKQIQNLDEVQECYHMAGQVDFILKIHTKSLEEYHDFVKTKLSKIENIGVLNSTFVLKEIKHTSEFYIFMKTSPE